MTSVFAENAKRSARDGLDVHASPNPACTPLHLNIAGVRFRRLPIPAFATGSWVYPVLCNWMTEAAAHDTSFVAA